MHVYMYAYKILFALENRVTPVLLLPQLNFKTVVEKHDLERQTDRQIDGHRQLPYASELCQPRHKQLSTYAK